MKRCFHLFSNPNFLCSWFWLHRGRQGEGRQLKASSVTLSNLTLPLKLTNNMSLHSAFNMHCIALENELLNANDSCQQIAKNIANLFLFFIFGYDLLFWFQGPCLVFRPINHVNSAMNQISTIAKPSQGPDWD